MKEIMNQLVKKEEKIAEIKEDNWITKEEEKYMAGSDWRCDSYFDGGMFEWLIIRIAGILITVFSLGLLYPWAVCLMYGWETNHTVIEGRRLRFTGTGIGLFGNWIKWWILIFLTFGIYGLWVHTSIMKWKVKNTIFSN